MNKSDLLKYKLFIFDFDGTLYDSMEMWAKMASSYIRYYGITPREDLDNDVMYFTNYETARILKSEYPLFDDMDEYLADMAKYIDVIYPYQSFKKGIIDILDFVKRNNKTTVILSATEKSLINSVLNNHKCMDIVDDIISTSDLMISKETGEGFSYVLNKYNLKPNDVIVFEDSLNAIKGAKLVGINSYGVKDYANIDKEKEIREVALDYIDF